MDEHRGEHDGSGERERRGERRDGPSGDATARRRMGGQERNEGQRTELRECGHGGHRSPPRGRSRNQKRADERCSDDRVVETERILVEGERERQPAVREQHAGGGAPEPPAEDEQQ
jgi:hypothetical protein